MPSFTNVDLRQLAAVTDRGIPEDNLDRLTRRELVAGRIARSRSQLGRDRLATIVERIEDHNRQMVALILATAEND